jgi:spore germination cell wall hydrolase CwlJ-like protein
MLTLSLRAPNLRFAALERKHWPTGIVLLVMLALYLLAGFSVTNFDLADSSAVARVAAPELPARSVVAEAPPKPEPLAFRAIAPQDAVAINAAIPVSTAPNPAARAFHPVAGTPDDRMRSVECLTAAVYYEAGSESLDGQRAVAQVVLNRVRHPAYPNSVCAVVFEGAQRATGCQFTFTCDGAMRRVPSVAGWARARKVAEAALAGKVYAPVGYATHYHTNWVVPYWSESLVKVANVGTHIFYRWSGGWGRPPAFTSRYAGSEPQVASPRSLAGVPVTLVAAGGDEIAAAVRGESVKEGTIDGFQRAVLRRYEPATREGVTAVLAAQTKAGDSVPSAYRWAMTGAASEGASKQAPLGKAAPAGSSSLPCAAEGLSSANASGAEADARKTATC